MADSDNTYGDIMQCECGYTCRRDELPWKQTQKTRYNCPPEDDCEDWYETKCPECGEMESFEEFGFETDCEWDDDTIAVLDAEEGT